MQLKVYGAVLVLALTASTAQAAWSVSTGRVTSITTYENTNIILFTTDNQPSGPLPTGCTTMSAFAVDGALSADKRQTFLAQLMTAQSTRQQVAVTWEDSGGCVVYDPTSKFPRLVRLAPS